jgi:hypothetical protein
MRTAPDARLWVFNSTTAAMAVRYTAAATCARVDEL